MTHKISIDYFFLIPLSSHCISVDVCALDLIKIYTRIYTIVELCKEMNSSEYANTHPHDSVEVPPSRIENIEEKNSEESSSVLSKCSKWMKIYMTKFRGLHEERPKRLSWQEYFWSFLGALLGIAAVAFLHFRLLEP